MLTDALVAAVVERNRLQEQFLRLSLDGLSANECEQLENYLAFCDERGLNLQYLALSYDTVVRDHFREQVYFKRHGRYRYSTFDEVAASVYNNPDYMGRYMHGLGLTQFLWPNHREMHRFFAQTLPRSVEGRYLEVGPGHGMFMMTAMRIAHYRHYVGVDVSETSIDITRAVLEHPVFGSPGSYSLEVRDFLASSVDDEFDAVVMGEVLEHVEQPKAFLAKAREVTRPGGYFYMSTAVNGPVIDHIALFRTVAEVDALVESAGFTIDGRLVIPHPGTTLEVAEQQKLPVSVAYALR